MDRGEREARVWGQRSTPLQNGLRKWYKNMILEMSNRCTEIDLCTNVQMRRASHKKREAGLTCIHLQNSVI